MAEQMVMLDKFTLTKHLDEVARKSESAKNKMLMPRPKSYTISEAKLIPIEDQLQNLVLKRNGSSNRNHVVLPPHVMPLEHNITDHSTSPLGVYGTWFAQDYVENLKTMGEIRVFMDGTKAIETILATKFTQDTGSEMEMEVIRGFPSLQNVPRYVYSKKRTRLLICTLASQNLCSNPISATAQEKNKKRARS